MAQFSDGPRAWRMTLHMLKGKARTKKDRTFYSVALQFQINNRLSESCTAEEYSSRARAFLTKINPNLQNPYSGDDGHGNDDISEYLVELMPSGMRTIGKQITMELKMNKLYSNYEEVITRCKSAVFEEQKGGNAKPSFVLTTQAISLACVDVNLTNDIAELSNVTGIAASFGSGGGLAPLPVGIAAPYDKKYCNKCPHIARNGKR